MNELEDIILTKNNKLGICFKCGKKEILQAHHWKGYSEEHKDETKPYCRSCDLKAHAKARREGRCKLSHEKAEALSKKSYLRRAEERIDFWVTVGTNALLHECIIYNKKSGAVYITSRFLGNHSLIIPQVIL